MPRIRAYILLEVLIANTLNITIFAISLFFLLIITRVSMQLQQQFKIKHAKAITQYYLRKDLFNNKSINSCQDPMSCIQYQNLTGVRSLKPGSDILLITTDNGSIMYYLRTSIVSSFKYALYRDDNLHNATALVEDILDLKLQILHKDNGYSYNIAILFADGFLELQCYNNTCRVMY